MRTVRPMLQAIGVMVGAVLTWVWVVVVWSVASANDDLVGYLTGAALTVGPAGLLAVVLIRGYRHGHLGPNLPLIIVATTLVLLLAVAVSSLTILVM